MEYVYEGRIVREINELIEEKFNSPDNTKTKEELYNECYEEVIQLYADYLYFDSIGYLDPKGEVLNRVRITGYKSLVLYNTNDKRRFKDYCFLTKGTKVYQSILEFKIFPTEDKDIFQCEFKLFMDERELPRTIQTIGKYRCETINKYCFEYIYIPEEEIF